MDRIRSRRWRSPTICTQVSRPPTADWRICRPRAGSSLPAASRSIARRDPSRRRSFSPSSSGACMPEGSFPGAARRQVRDDSLEPRPRRRAEVGSAFGRRADRTVRDVLVSGLRVHPPAGLSCGGMRGPDAGILRARAREELLSRRRSGERPLSRLSLRRRSATFSRTSAIAPGR